MAKNITKEFVIYDSDWLAQGGVKNVRVNVYAKLPSQIIAGGVNGAILENGDRYAWGTNTNGGLGDQTVIAKSSPILVHGSRIWRDGSAAISLGVDILGDAYGWGLNSSGQIGDNTITSRSSPTLVVGGYKWRRIASRNDFSLGLRENGALYAWGQNADGQLGDNTVTLRSSPVLVLGGFTKWADFKTGTSHCVAIDAASKFAYCWGAGGSGRLGNNAATSRSTPVAVTNSNRFKQVDAGNDFTVGLTEDGFAFSWGSDGATGQLGHNTSGVNKSTPTQVSGDRVFKKIAVGFQHTIALGADGLLYGWGANTTGALGDNTVIARSSPTLVVGSLTNVHDIKAHTNSMAQLNDGSLYAWGINSGGLGGDGTATNRSSPVAVLGFPSLYKTQLLSKQMVASVAIPVVPGTVYPVVIQGRTVKFGGIPIYTNDSLQTEVELEYFT